MRFRPSAWTYVWLLAALGLLTVCTVQAHTATPQILRIEHAEAAPAGWYATTPPVGGWVQVTLMDLWNTRWPHHDGVVWYRLHWRQASTDIPVGLLLDYVCLADAVYLNGSLIHRDPQLVEPLSRSWIRPQYFLLDRPLLRQGDNTLLVRVSGLAAYQPGLGSVAVGDPRIVEKLFRQDMRWRYDLQLFDQAVGLVLGGLFGMFWLFRRRDAVYGWYALSALLFAGYGVNYIADSTWPFPGTDAWEAFNSALYVAAASSFAIFLLRYCQKQWPRVEKGLCVANGLSFAYALLLPASAGLQRGILVSIGGGLYYAAIFAFIVHAVRTRRVDQRVLAACLLVPVLTSGHDFLLFFGVIHSDTYLLALTSPLTLIGMGFVLAHRFAAAIRRAESFNIELRREVEAATRNLSTTLAREHALALANSRIGERLNLVRDLHDGFGGSLLGAIAALERSPPSAEASRSVATLKELRDDLRLVIDTTTHEQDTDLAGLLAPLRHRWSQRLEMVGIDSRWHMDGLEGLHIGPARSLDLQRLLQEALTNVLKHSGATNVAIRVERRENRLHLDVHDDGNGFGTAMMHDNGMGLASLRARARRLGGDLLLQTARGCHVGVDFEVCTAR